MPTSDSALIKRYKENWQSEIDSAHQYNFLADTEKNLEISSVFRNLAKVEQAHAGFWQQKLQQKGVDVGHARPSWRARVLKFYGKLNRQSLITQIARSEHISRNDYTGQPETADTKMAAQERWHAALLGEIARDTQGVEGPSLGRLEGRHKAASGNALRAAVLGANDGLCSNLSLVMGVAGASMNSHTLILTGSAGLLAGAFSMALGEYISVTSARELATREIRIESDELDTDFESEMEELRLIYRAKGLSEAEANSLVDGLTRDKGKALETLTREELGLNPKDLGGSALEAATTSFVLFALGALVPLIPFFLFDVTRAVEASVVFSGVILFGVGAMITVFTGRSVWFSGLRQMLLGLCAAAATFFIGHWIAGKVV